MPNMFLTGSDQIIDYNYVAAIEIVDAAPKHASVHFHLSTGVTIVSPHDSHESAVTEKWQAYQQMSPHNKRMRTEPAVGRVANG